jgi:hypothetical protein
MSLFGPFHLCHSQTDLIFKDSCRLVVDKSKSACKEQGFRFNSDI